MTEEKITPTKSRKEREKEQRRNEIIVVAERLFLSQGFESTTMDQIANEAEFSKGTLYNYFISKDDLYLTIGVKAYTILIEYTDTFIKQEEPGVAQETIGLPRQPRGIRCPDRQDRTVERSARR